MPGAEARPINRLRRGSDAEVRYVRHYRRSGLRSVRMSGKRESSIWPTRRDKAETRRDKR